MVRKSVGQVAREAGRNIETRMRSRKAQNERRKIERRMARIIKEETGQKVSAKEAVEMLEKGEYSNPQLQSLAKARESISSGVGKSGYAADVSKVAESLEAFTEIRFGSSNLSKNGTMDKYRRNKMFERNINQSTMKDGLSALTREETKAFYAGTRDLWGGQSTANNRNATIMQEFGVNDLQTVYELLTKENLDYRDYGFMDEETFNEYLETLNQTTDLMKRREIIIDELKDIRAAQKTGGTTDDEAYNRGDEKQVERSPEYSNRIISRIARALNYG